MAGSHACAAGCGGVIADPPPTFPRTPATLYCSPTCKSEGNRRALRRSYGRHRTQRIAEATAWQLAHPEQARETRIRRDRANPERVAIASRKWKLRNRFGLSLADYDELLAKQGGVCAICQQPEDRLNRRGQPKALALDHDHETGALRGLLCQDCNHALGWLERFRREPGWQFAAVAYLSPEQRQEA